MLNQRCINVLKIFIEQYNRNSKHIEGIYNRAKRACKNQNISTNEFDMVCEELFKRGYLDKKQIKPIKSKITKDLKAYDIYCLTEKGRSYFEYYDNHLQGKEQIMNNNFMEASISSNIVTGGNANQRIKKEE